MSNAPPAAGARHAPRSGRLHPRLALVVLLALAPAVGLSIYISLEQWRMSLARVNGDAIRMAQLAASSQEGILESTRNLLAALGDLPQIKEGTNWVMLDSHCRNLLKLYPVCVEFGLLDQDGRQLASSSKTSRNARGPDQRRFQEAYHRARFVVGGYEPATNGHPEGLSFGLPILNADREVTRVLYALVSTKAVESAATRVDLPADTELVIADLGGNVLVRHPEPSNWRGRSIAALPLFQRASGSQGGTAELPGLDERSRLFAFARAQGGGADGLIVSVGVSTDAAYAETRETLALMLLLVGMATILAWVAANWYAGARILWPLNRLASTAAHLGRGDWTARTGLPHGRGELGQLARTFDELAQTLEHKQAEGEQAASELRAAEAQFRTLVEQSLVGIYIIQEGRLKYVNPKFVEIVGRTQEEVTGCPVQDVVAEADRPLVAENIRKRLTGGIRSIRYHLRCVRPDGSLVHVEAHGAAVEYNGRPAIIGAMLDVTEQVRAEAEIRRLNASLEQRVRDRTAQLEEANCELEAFAYSVSHDLRAPLRHIDGFVGLLGKAEHGKLGETSRRHLDVIASSARQMGRLIDELLAFSRMSRTQMAVRPVDLQLLVKEIIRRQTLVQEGREIVWQIGRLPIVEGDPTLLGCVFENLVSNAIKYTRGRDPAVIAIGIHESLPHEVVLFVRDNGAGFDMQYAHKLFGVFQRLHRAEEFEGTGIGLANVRRIVARHAGRTWAEGRVNEGATFYVSLPKPANHNADGHQAHTPG